MTPDVPPRMFFTMIPNDPPQDFLDLVKSNLEKGHPLCVDRKTYSDRPWLAAQWMPQKDKDLTWDQVGDVELLYAWQEGNPQVIWVVPFGCGQRPPVEVVVAGGFPDVPAAYSRDDKLLRDCRLTRALSERGIVLDNALPGDALGRRKRAAWSPLSLLFAGKDDPRLVCRGRPGTGADAAPRTDDKHLVHIADLEGKQVWINRLHDWETKDPIGPERLASFITLLDHELGGIWPWTPWLCANFPLYHGAWPYKVLYGAARRALRRRIDRPQIMQPPSGQERNTP